MISLSGLDERINALVSPSEINNLTSDGFTEDLAQAFASVLGSSKGERQLRIDVDPKRQSFTVSTSPYFAQADIERYGSAVAFMQGSVEKAPAPSALTEETSGPTEANGASQESATAEPEAIDAFDAYWAQQPPALQTFRSISNLEQRVVEADRLSAQGYSVDPLVMVYNWDPVSAMRMRRVNGFTWVPAWGQRGVPVAPGSHLDGFPDYDAAHPPAGSIPVSLDFARGTRLNPLYFQDVDAVAVELNALRPSVPSS